MTEAHARKNSPSWRKAVKEHCGTKCVNCGATENIEYHHIVPIFMGGADELSNIVCLCHSCHEKSHAQIPKVKKGQPNIGRKNIAKKKADERFRIYEMFINGEIGNRKAKEMLGYSQGSHMCDLVDFKEYLNNKGIAKVHNRIDVTGTNGDGLGLRDGKKVGVIVMKNGERIPMYYHETGDNDCEYINRRRGETMNAGEKSEEGR